MTDAMRIRIAALVTACFIAALTVAGIAVRADHHVSPQAQPAATAPAVVAPASSAVDDDLEELGDE